MLASACSGARASSKLPAMPLRGLAHLFASTSSAPKATAPAVNNDNDETMDLLVQNLLKQGVVQPGGPVEAALRANDRREFCSTHMGIPAHVSYSDNQVAIGQGQTISAPSLHAACLELLEGHARPGAAALDVGAGSGYLTACLSMMVGPEGRVVALERQERLVAQAGWALARTLSMRLGSAQPTGGPASGRQQQAWQQQQQQQQGAGRLVVRLHNIELMHGNALDDAVLQAASAGRLFDVIHVGAAAREVPAALLALLRPGGRMVLPLGPPVSMQWLTVVDKAADGTVSQSRVRDVKLPPLVPPNAEKPL